MRFLKLLTCCVLSSISNIVFTQNTSVIPLPKIIKWDTLAYQLPTDQEISYNDGAERAAVWLGKLLENTGKITYSKNGNGNWQIVYSPSLISDLGEEGYLLDINDTGIKIQGASNKGLFYAIQTLRQLLPEDLERHTQPSGNIHLKYVHIKDAPFYSWRGCMIDLARNFIDLPYLKEHIDRMALYKLNRLHLHLTDDQGWRIEIKSLPNLTAVGSTSACNNGTTGFLTQEQYKELQDYAEERMITVIPEVDMPGHIYSALASYPELNCSDFSNLNPRYATPPSLYSGMRVGWSKFCFTKTNTVYNFVSTVIGELISLTKGSWIHIGGDEIADPAYETFMYKADSIVRSKGKISIAWEEAMRANVSNTLIGQVWTGTSGNPNGCSTIISLCSNFYLDHGNVSGQPNTADWCGASLPIEKIYNFTMSGAFHDPKGVEAALWTERVIGYEAFDNRLWPRLTAVAEVAWTEPSQREFSNFKLRLGEQGKRFDYMGVKYYNTPDIFWTTGAVSVPATNVFSGYITNTNVLLSVTPYSHLFDNTPLVLYPNPTSDNLNMNKKLYHIEIFDSMGKLVLKANESQHLNISSLSEGIYFLHALNGYAKFIVERK